MTSTMSEAQNAGPSRLVLFRRSLTRRDRRSLAGMAGFIVLLHLIGFGILFGLVVPHHYPLGGDHPDGPQADGQGQFAQVRHGPVGSGSGDGPRRTGHGRTHRNLLYAKVVKWLSHNDEQGPGVVSTGPG